MKINKDILARFNLIFRRFDIITNTFVNLWEAVSEDFYKLIRFTGLNAFIAGHEMAKIFLKGINSMEQKEILEHLLAIRTLILNSMPLPNLGYKNSGMEVPENQFNAWNDGYNQAFQDCKKSAINVINKEINNILGVDIIGMKY